MGTGFSSANLRVRNQIKPGAFPVHPAFALAQEISPRAGGIMPLGILVIDDEQIGVRIGGIEAKIHLGGGQVGIVEVRVPKRLGGATASRPHGQQHQREANNSFNVHGAGPENCQTVPCLKILASR